MTLPKDTAIPPKKAKISFYNSIGDIDNESGRSLVEMLGMLAIIGILSTVGVKAFHSAITQHRANELINEAQKRAVIVAAQIMAGQSNLSIGEFKDPEGYSFGVTPENAQQFKITLNQVDEEICTKMKGNIGSSTPIRHINKNCTEMIFNNDLSTTSAEQCTGAGKIWCANTNLCSTTGACCGNKDCTANQCPANSSTDGAGGTTGIFVNGTECKCESETAVYTGTKCETQPAECHDWTKNECGFGYYCQFSYSDDTNQIGESDIDNQSCYANLSGTCKKITTQEILTSSQMAILTAAGFKSTFVSSSSHMRWWSAASWCLGQGKRLIDISKIECYRQGKTLVKTGGTYAMCCKKGQSCQSNSWTDLWNGNEIISGKEAEVAKFSDKIVALRKAYGGFNIYTGSTYNAHNAPNSCAAFLISVVSGYVSPGYRNLNYKFFCE